MAEDPELIPDSENIVVISDEGETTVTLEKITSAPTFNETISKINEIIEELNGKADTDLSNLTSGGKVVCANLAMPSDNYIDLTLGSSGATYTAPADGYYTFTGSQQSTATGAFIFINTTGGMMSLNSRASTSVQSRQCFIPAKKGDVVQIGYDGTFSNVVYFRFVYAEGSAE